MTTGPHTSPSTPQNSSPAPHYDVADLLILYLQQLQVDYIFGIPGGAIEPLYNALARSERRGGPRAIISRHETGATFMADGYTTQTGKLGVCCATTGPGATNLITGVASAYANHIPMLVITAQTSLTSFGKGAFQESSCTGINTVGMMSYCTRYNTLVSHADQFEQKLFTAISNAFGPSPGPVHLSIPLDVMRTPVPQTQPQFDVTQLQPAPAQACSHDIDLLAGILKKNTKPVFVIGEGAVSAMSSILSLAQLLDATLLTTPHGKGLINPHHPQFAGIVGFAGHTSATDALLDPLRQTTICIGTSLGEWATNGWDSRLLLNDRLIHIDQEWEHFQQTPMARLHIFGDIEHIFSELLLRINPRESNTDKDNQSTQAMVLDDASAYTSTSVPIKPQRLMRELTRLFPSKTHYLADTGASFAWAIHYLHPFDQRMGGCRNPRGIGFRASLEFSSMGWAIGCAIGTALACPDRPIVCITGDGSLLMSGQELTVAVEHELPIIFVILNDSSLGMVKHGQRLSGAESIGTKIPFVDFAAMARAMGAKGITIESAADLRLIDVDALSQRDGPTLMDVRIDVDEVPPIGTRIAVLKESRQPLTTQPSSTTQRDNTGTPAIDTKLATEKAKDRAKKRAKERAKEKVDRKTAAEPKPEIKTAPKAETEVRTTSSRNDEDSVHVD